MLEFYASLGRVVILDHRGFGVSDPLPLDRVGNLDEMTYDVVAVLDAVAAAEATVVATMAACYVAVHLAAGYPERVKQLALLNPKRGGSYAVEPLGDLGGDTRARWGRGDLTRLVAAHLTDADRTWVGRHERRAAAPAGC